MQQNAIFREKLLSNFKNTKYNKQKEKLQKSSNVES